MRAKLEQLTAEYARPNESSPPTANRNAALEDLVEEFSARLEHGEQPQIDEFVAEHPEHADRLRRILPTMRMLADFSRGDHSTDLVPHNPLADALGQDGTLGDFRIVREVGRGGMGVVYEAQQISLSRRVALKILPFAAVLDPRHLQRFKNEALAAAHLDHPNIVEVYGIGCERGIHFYAMRYVEGQTLAAVIDALRNSGSTTSPASAPGSAGDDDRTLQHRPRAEPRADDGKNDDPASPIPHFSFAETSVIAALSTLRTEKPRNFFRRVAELGIQAAEALDHAHQMGIVHRDIKPSNLMVDCSHLAPRDGASLNPDHRPLTTPKLWITDFGLARFENDPGMTMTGDLIGTLRYMSPEQALAKRVTVDHRTDIYSLGITLYELLTLQPAFNGADREEVLRQIAFADPAPLRRRKPAIPVELETIIHKAISKNPDDRYATAREMADDLVRFCADQPIRAKPPGRVQRLAKWSRRHAVMVSATAIVLGGLAAAALASTWLVAQSLRSESEARRLAQSNLRRGNQAVERLLSRVAEEQLLHEPRMENLRRSLLIDALQVNNALLEENSEDAEARFETAKAYRRAAEIQNEIGENNDDLGQSAPSARAEEALSILIQLLAESPHEQRFRRELARAYVTLNWSNLIRAGMSYDAAATWTPNFEKAVEIHQELLKEYPDDAELLFGLTRCLVAMAFQRRNSGAHYQTVADISEKSVATAERLCYLHPNNAEYCVALADAYRALGGFLHEAGKPAESKEKRLRALTESTTAVNLAPRGGHREAKIRALLSLARLCRVTNEFTDAWEYTGEAKRLAQELAADYPSNRVYRRLCFDPVEDSASLFEAQHQSDKALQEIEQFQVSLRLPLDADGNLATDATLSDRELFRSCQRALENIHRRRGDIASASTAIDKLLRVDTDFGDLANRAANLATSDPRDPANALKLAQRALELAPREAGVWNALGLAHFSAGKWHDAIAALQKSMSLAKGKNEAYNTFALAMAHWQLGHQVDAKEWFSRAVAWTEQNQPTNERLMRFRAEAEELLGIPEEQRIGFGPRGIKLFFKQDATDADRELGIKQLAKALKVAPRSSEWRYPLALAQYRVGRYLESLANFKEIVKQHRKPGGPDFNKPEGTAWDFFYVSMNYARLGNFGEADHWFDKGVAWMEQWDPQNDPNNRGGRFPSTDVMEQHVPGYSDLDQLHKEAAELLKQSRAQAEK